MSLRQVSLVLFCGLVAVAFLGRSEALSCTGCTNCPSTITVNAGSFTAITSPICSGTLPTIEVDNVDVVGTSGDSFQVLTQDNVGSSIYYTDASNTATTSCFHMDPNRAFYGNSNKIYLLLSCKNSLLSCNFHYYFNTRCSNGTPGTYVNQTTVSAVGAIVGSIIGFLVICGIVYYCCYYRPKQLRLQAAQAVAVPTVIMLPAMPAASPTPVVFQTQPQPVMMPSQPAVGQPAPVMIPSPQVYGQPAQQMYGQPVQQPQAFDPPAPMVLPLEKAPPAYTPSGPAVQAVQVQPVQQHVAQPDPSQHNFYNAPGPAPAERGFYS